MSLRFQYFYFLNMLIVFSAWYKLTLGFVTRRVCLSSVPSREEGSLARVVVGAGAYETGQGPCREEGKSLGWHPWEKLTYLIHIGVMSLLVWNKEGIQRPRKGGDSQLELSRRQLGRVPKRVFVSEPLVQGKAVGNLPPHKPSCNISVFV